MPSSITEIHQIAIAHSLQMFIVDKCLINLWRYERRHSFNYIIKVDKRKEKLWKVKRSIKSIS